MSAYAVLPYPHIYCIAVCLSLCLASLLDICPLSDQNLVWNLRCIVEPRSFLPGLNICGFEVFANVCKVQQVTEVSFTEQNCSSLRKTSRLKLHLVTGDVNLKVYKASSKYLSWSLTKSEAKVAKTAVWLVKIFLEISGARKHTRHAFTAT